MISTFTHKERHDETTRQRLWHVDTKVANTIPYNTTQSTSIQLSMLNAGECKTGVASHQSKALRVLDGEKQKLLQRLQILQGQRYFKQLFQACCKTQLPRWYQDSTQTAAKQRCAERTVIVCIGNIQPLHLHSALQESTTTLRAQTAFVPKPHIGS